MGKEEFEQGVKAENLVHQICEKMFLSDFVIPNPKYVKKSGVENEIADTLILFNTNLIGFQVKSKKELKSLSEKTEVDLSRIHKRIADGIMQLSSVRKALQAHEQLLVKNKIGIEIELNTKTIHKIIGVVILDLVGDNQLPENERMEILGGFSWNGDIPVHIFMRSDLEIIAEEIDTQADFVNYLNMRAELYSKQILVPTVSEHDYLALYKLNPGILADAIAGKIDSLAISEGHWDEYVGNQGEQRERIKKLNQSSYYVDEIISYFHTSIGFSSPELQKNVMRNDLGQGTVASYFAIISELASLTRFERRVVGEMLIRSLTQAEKTGYSLSFCTLIDKSKGALILSTNKDRASRLIALQNLSAMAYCRYGLKEIIGIATETLSFSNRSYDVYALKDVEFENEQELIEASNRSFQSGRHMTIGEFSESRVVAKKNFNE